MGDVVTLWTLATLQRAHDEYERVLFEDSLPPELRYPKADTLGMNEDVLIPLVRARRAERDRRWLEWQFIRGDWS
jgi:hypothetical protein